MTKIVSVSILFLSTISILAHAENESEPNNDFGQAQPIDIGSTTGFADKNDVDWYQYTAEPAEANARCFLNVTLNFNFPEGSQSDGGTFKILEINPATGAQIDEHGSGDRRTSFERRFSIEEARTFYFQVDPHLTDINDYTLALSTEGDCSGALSTNEVVYDSRDCTLTMPNVNVVDSEGVVSSQQFKVVMDRSFPNGGSCRTPPETIDFNIGNPQSDITTVR
ncbi:MAG: hypothetical protein V3U75_10825 [Methylococcaceae bacterium]